MATIFSRIAAGEIPCYKIAEDEHFLAFLDINPLHEGHTLVIPKREEDYLFSLDDQELSGLIIFSKRVALAVEQCIPCSRIGVAVIGLEVPHAHVHLVPIHGIHDLEFSRPKLKFSEEQFQNTAARIRAAFQ